MANAVFPLAYYYGFPREDLLKLLLILSFGALAVEYGRLHSPRIQKLFLNTVGFALRSHENISVTGATYVFGGMTLTVFIFPQEIAIPAMLVLTISDAFAALGGIPLGRHKFLSKSLEGSLAFFVSALAVFLIFPVAPWTGLLLVALLATILEAWPKNFDDNILIPLFVGTMLYFVQLLFT